MINSTAEREPQPAWDSRRLWSLWDMLILDAREFIELLHVLDEAEQASRGANDAPIPQKTIDKNNEGVRETIRRLKNLDLPVSVKTAEHMCEDCESNKKLHLGVVQLSNTVKLELEGRKFYGPLRRYEQYYEQTKLFGDEVFTNFSSANNDIFEAGACLALERGTACVMHLMRVAEVGLKVLADTLSVGKQNDWGSYLREIDKELAARLKTAGKHTSDEQFYAEARVTIDGVRMAWRNPTMHIENNYSPERAEEILIAVRSLMRHLATKLVEW